MPQVREYVPTGLAKTLLVDDAAHIYEKELIYEDNFVMRNHEFTYDDFLKNKEGSRYELEVKEDAVRGWASTGNMMIDRGFEVPMPVGHKGKESKAKIIRFFHKVNSNDKASLRGLVQFPDKETAETYKDTDISIYSEEEAEDGQGNKYAWPITHVCFTDYPSIPKLEPFRAIAASMLDTSEKDKTVATKVVPNPAVDIKDETLDTLLKKYGITVSEKATDEEKKKAIADYLKSVNEKFSLVVFEEEEKTPAQTNQKKAEPPKEEKEPVKIAAGLLSVVTRARETELDNLVRERRITPAQCKVLKNEWCSKEKVTIACSNDGEDDGFERQLSILKMNEPQKDGTTTGHQHIELSQGNSSLVENAKKRREREEKRQVR